MGFLDSIIQAADLDVTLESSVAPPISIALPSSGDVTVGDSRAEATFDTSTLMRFAKPKVIVRSGGQVLTSFAPYGEPDPDYQWIALAMVAGIAVVTGLAIYGAVRLFV